MAQSFPETYKPDPKLYAEGWDRIFGPKCDCHKYEEQVCDICMKISGLHEICTDSKLDPAN